MSLVSIETTRYSAVARKFVERYPGIIQIDRKVVQEPLDSWCTNQRLCDSIDFSLVHGGLEVLGFHDGPRNMWVHESTLPLVQQLAHERLLRFSLGRTQPRPAGFLHRLLSRVFGT